MEKKYREIEFTWGSTIELAVKQLLHCKNQGELVCGEFNGITLYSDTVTMDNAYKSITGRSKEEIQEKRRQLKEDYDRREKEHKDKIPELTKVWMKKGREVLTEDKWDYWDEIVPIRLGDLYHGMELGNCLDIVKVLNDGESLEVAKELIENQGHSGMSFGLVCSMVREFSDRGNEFAEYVR